MNRPTRASLTARPLASALTATATTLALVAVLPFPASRAATPSSGSVSPPAASVTYTGGDFDGTNQTGLIPIDPAPGVTPVCSSPLLPCDDFALTVTVPTDPHTYTIVVTVSVTTPTADFDLYLMDADGTTVDAGSANIAGEVESLQYPVPHGTSHFTVRVTPYDVQTGSSGDTYTGTVVLARTDQLDPPDPDEIPTVAGVPRFKNYHAPEGKGDSAGEPSLGANWTTGRVMFGSNLQTLRVDFDDCSSPARTTWEDKSAPTSVTSLDPILFTDYQTNRTFVSQLTGACSATSFTDDDGDTYTPSEGCGTPAGADHQTFGGGPFAPGPNGPITSYPNAVYYCSQENETSICALSQDGGLTFGPGVPAWNATQCGAFHGHLRVAPDGTAYVANRSCGGTQGVILTENNGLTWTVRHVTGSTPPKANALVDPSVSIGAQGRVYFGYMASNGHPMIAVSDDKGVTWNHNQDVGAPLGIKNSTFPEVIAGDNDRAAFAFLGTMTDGDYGDNIAFNGIWHLYVATTYDGGATWTTVDATPHDPVQRGSICNQGTVTCMHTPDDRNLLDFNDITIDRFGRILVAYADGCITNTCVHGSPTGRTANDFTQKATIARQSGGKGLLAQYDPVPAEPIVPRAPVLNAERPAPGVVHLSWEAPDNGGSPVTGYRMYRSTASGAETFLNATGARTEYQDITPDPGTAYYYRLRAVNAAGEGAFCGEVFVPAATTPGEDPCSGAGERVDTDGSDGAPNVPPTPAVNIDSVSVSEPWFADGSSKIVLTLQVGASAVPTPNSQWYILWYRPVPDETADRNYVAMVSDATGAVSFEYGTIAPTPYVNPPTRIGAADDGSYNPATGVIRITIANSRIDNVGPGSVLTDLQARTFFSRPAGGPVSQNATSDYSPTANYTLVGNGACRPNAAPTATLQVSPPAGCAPLAIVLDASSSSDPDAGDTIATYRFDFGDGTPPVVQASPTTSHIYASNGDYGARLHVTDSRGKISQNVDLKTIEVHSPPMAAASGSATICQGASTPLHGTGGESCAWSPATGLSDPASCDPVAHPAQTTTYTLTVTSEEGCPSPNAPSVTVTVTPCAIQEVDQLVWQAGGKSTLVWGASSGAASYRLYRGASVDLPALLTSTVDSCVRFEGSATSTGPILDESPASIAGRLYWYLVDGLNGTVEGPAGNATAGPRLVNPSGICP